MRGTGPREVSGFVFELFQGGPLFKRAPTCSLTWTLGFHLDAWIFFHRFTFIVSAFHFHHFSFSMPLFALQRVPARQNAHAVRGSDNLVTLQSAAQDGIHRALVALTVVDPHDPSKRAIPAYFIEGC